MVSTAEKPLDASSETATRLPFANPFIGAAWLELMSESAQFLAARFEKDFQAQQTLLACKTPEDVLQAQADFLGTAVQDYANGSTRLVDLLTTGAKTFTDALSTGSRRYDDLPL